MSFFHVLSSRERTKAPATGKISHNSLLLTSRKTTSLDWLLFATKSFHSVFGWCGTPSVSHSQSERLTSSQIVLATLSKKRMGFVCDFDGAGVSLISPLYAVKFASCANGYSFQKSFPRQRRKGTVENCE